MCVFGWDLFVLSCYVVNFIVIVLMLFIVLFVFVVMVFECELIGNGFDKLFFCVVIN